MKDDELQSWAEDFRTPDSVRVPSADEVMAQAARDRRSERLAWAGQIAGIAFAAGVFAWGIAFMRSAMFAAFAAIALPVSFGVFAFSVVLRSGGQRTGEALADHVARAVRHRRVNHRLVRASILALAVLTTAVWVWVPLFWYSRIERVVAHPWRTVVAAVAAVVVFGITFAALARTLRKTRRELERWLAIEAAVRDE
jgi:hypothetical protein